MFNVLPSAPRSCNVPCPQSRIESKRYRADQRESFGDLVGITCWCPGRDYYSRERCAQSLRRAAHSSDHEEGLYVHTNTAVTDDSLPTFSNVLWPWVLSMCPYPSQFRLKVESVQDRCLLEAVLFDTEIVGLLHREIVKGSSLELHA